MNGTILAYYLPVDATMFTRNYDGEDKRTIAQRDICDSPSAKSYSIARTRPGCGCWATAIRWSHR